MTDKLFLLLGTFCSILNGSAFPIVMLIFGQLTDTFIDQAVTMDIVRPDSTDIIISCLYGDINNTLDIEEALDVNITNGHVECNAQFNFENTSTTLEDIVSTCFGDGRKCLGNSAFIDEISTQCYIFTGIAVAIFILAAIQSLCFEYVAARQVHFIRQNFYRAVLRQDIGWFDANPSGELSSRLSE